MIEKEDDEQQADEHCSPLCIATWNMISINLLFYLSECLRINWFRCYKQEGMDEIGYVIRFIQSEQMFHLMRSHNTNSFPTACVLQ